MSGPVQLDESETKWKKNGLVYVSTIRIEEKQKKTKV